jgi:hypothetical protein
MLVTQIISGAPHTATQRRRTATTIRRAALVLGAIGMLGAAAVTTAGSAIAGVGSEPGHLKFSPASGATTLTPTWSTSDGCPSGYQGSAQMAIFNVSGTLLSSISSVAYNVRGPFSGSLQGSMGAILKFAHVRNGGSLEFTMGCYTQVGGAGNFTWIQSALVTLSSDGRSYSTSTPSGRWATSASNQAQGPLAGPNAAGTGAGTTANDASASGAEAGGGMGAPAIAGLVAAAGALAAGAAGFVWYRRRNRSRLM